MRQTYFTMMYSSILAASVLRGDSSVSEEFLDIVKILPSDGNRDIRKSDNPIPVWLIGEDERSVRYYRSACRTEEGYSVGNFARKYMPKPDPVLSLVDEQAVAEGMGQYTGGDCRLEERMLLTRPPDFFFVSKDGQERETVS